MAKSLQTGFIFSIEFVEDLLKRHCLESESFGHAAFTTIDLTSARIKIRPIVY